MSQSIELREEELMYRVWVRGTGDDKLDNNWKQGLQCSIESYFAQNAFHTLFAHYRSQHSAYPVLPTQLICCRQLEGFNIIRKWKLACIIKCSILWEIGQQDYSTCTEGLGRHEMEKSVSGSHSKHDDKAMETLQGQCEGYSPTDLNATSKHYWLYMDWGGQ